MSNIEVVEYTENKKGEWNEFVANSNNGTVFHNLDFLSYHGDKFSKNEHHLMFYYKGQNLIGVIPLAIFEKEDKLVAKSPYGGSFGGIVVKDHFKFRYSEELINSMVKFFRDNNFDEVYITLPPLIYSRVPNCYIEFNLLKNNFEIINREITSVIKLDCFDSDPCDIFEKRARTAVKKARKKGVSVVESSDDYNAFYKILKEAKARHNAKSTHTLSELMKLHDILPNSIKLDIAYVHDEPAAGILYFICNSQVILTFYICHKTAYGEFYPTNLLIYHGMRWAKKNKFKYLDLGTTARYSLDSDAIVGYGVFMFKESFGSVGYFRDTFKWKNNLTNKQRAGDYRRMIG